MKIFGYNELAVRLPVAIAVLFTAFLLYFFRYLHEDAKQKKRYLLIASIGLTFAVLTKGVAGLLVVPGLALYVLFEKKAKEVLSGRQFYASMIIFILPVGGFYLLREIYSPGYLNAVYLNELGGRFNETIEGHNHPFGFYFNALLFDGKWLGIKARFLPMLFFIPLAVFIKLLNTAVFVYYMEATLISGEQISKKGNVSLIR